MGERVAIIGTRKDGWQHPWWAERCVRRYVIHLLSEGDVVVSGGANGVDSWAVDAARSRGLLVVEHKPDWQQFGRGAAFKRNWQIIKDCDRVVAFWNGTSKGTIHSMEAAREISKPITIINPDEKVPEWWKEPKLYAF